MPELPFYYSHLHNSTCEYSVCTYGKHTARLLTLCTDLSPWATRGITLTHSLTPGSEQAEGLLSGETYNTRESVTGMVNT